MVHGKDRRLGRDSRKPSNMRWAIRKDDLTIAEVTRLRGLRGIYP